MVKERFKLPRSSYEELKKIIMAYKKLGKPGSLQDVRSFATVREETISHNNKFLIATGIIEGGQKKVITEKGKELGEALEYEYDKPEVVMNSWEQIINENEFLTKMVQAVRVRDGMEKTDLKNHIAYSAGESKRTDVLTGAATVIQILINSGLVSEDEDRIIPVSREIDPKISTEKGLPKIPGEKVALTAEIVDKITIIININANPSEMEELPEKIFKFIEELRTPKKS